MNLPPSPIRLPAPACKITAWPLPLIVFLASQHAFAGAPFDQFVDPHPAPGNRFGATVVALSTGNVVVTSPGDDTNGTDTGAVYLFNGATGALISELHGSSDGDSIGSTGVTALSNGNYVVSSPSWDNGAVADAGAITWGNGTTGISGVVSAANSLVGSSLNDGIGGFSGITPLTNGNYVVASREWDNGAVADVGAVTWGNGATGVKGVVGADNSLVGSSLDDSIGGFSGITPLTNGNYVVSSPDWDNGAVADAGAVTWGNGTTGIKGVVGAANSLVGSSLNDRIGGFGDVTVLTTGNYVVASPDWDNGAVAGAGAVTWGSGTTGVKGAVGTGNSLVGSTAFDSVGSGFVTALSNGNYVVTSQSWDNGAVADAGAVTWGNGTSGIKGVVSATNSLVGGKENDQVGSGSFFDSVTPLSNGNYVVVSPFWDNGAVADAGAVTWGNGTTGIKGLVSAGNSLVGSTNLDSVGSGNSSFEFGFFPGVPALSNGNYVVESPSWDNGAAVNAGAVTWGNGTTGVKGVIGAGNSLVGSKADDRIGSGRVTALSNGNYVVTNPDWDNGAVVDAGAVTWGSGTSGVKGLVGAGNSLVGSKDSDAVGNSEDFGHQGVTALSKGNYTVQSPSWDNGSVVDAGAVTWGSGTTGIKGLIGAGNSLVGSTANDGLGGGLFPVTPLTNGNYVVGSPGWDNGAAADAGAVTWGSGTTGIKGLIGVGNSLVGSSAGDAVGSFDSGFGVRGITPLSNGNYVVASSSWGSNAGAVTWGNGTTGVSGTIRTANSAIGPGGLQEVVLDDVNGTFFACFPNFDGGIIRVGSQTTGIGSPLPSITVKDGPVFLVEGSPESVNFTSTGAPVSKTFTITNGGVNNLVLGAISIDGSNAASFVAGDPGKLTLGNGASTTLTVTFTPGLAATESARLRIGSNVAGTANPFDINLTGTLIIDLPTALDTTGLTWSVGGDGNWFAQKITTHDTVDAAQSGVIGDNQETWTETTVSGSGYISFWWKASSESGFDYLEFYIDGVLQQRISGEMDWQQKTYLTGAGTHTLRWSYAKDSSISSGSDAGWVDQVVWTPSSADVYPVWAQGFFSAAQLADPSLSGSSANPDNDDIPNLLELILGGNPLVADNSVLPMVTYTKISGGQKAVYSYNRKLVAAGITQVVEYSTTMSGAWSSALHGVGGVTIAVAPVDAMTEQVTVSIPFTDDKGFVRLRGER